MILFDDYEDLMALTEITRDSLEVDWEQCIYVTTKEVVLKGSTSIAEKDVKWVSYEPSTPLDEVPEKFRAIAEVLWTEEIIEEYIERHPAPPEEPEPDPA